MINSAEEFVMLRTSEDKELYTKAAHEEASEEVWLDVIARYPDMRVWVAHNKTVLNTILAILADDEDWRVRVTVAMRRKADPAILEKLAHDPEESVRHAVAGNAKTPLYILEGLLDDEEDIIREIVRKRVATQTSYAVKNFKMPDIAWRFIWFDLMNGEQLDNVREVLLKGWAFYLDESYCRVKRDGELFLSFTDAQFIMGQKPIVFVYAKPGPENLEIKHPLKKSSIYVVVNDFSNEKGYAGIGMYVYSWDNEASLSITEQQIGQLNDMIESQGFNIILKLKS